MRLVRGSFVCIEKTKTQATTTKNPRIIMALKYGLVRKYGSYGRLIITDKYIRKNKNCGLEFQ